MLSRNYRNSIIALIAVGLCAFIIRGSSFLKNGHESDYPSSAIHRSAGLDQSEASSNSIGPEVSQLSTPAYELLEPLVHHAEEESVNISVLPQLDHSALQETTQKSFDGSGYAPIEQPSQQLKSQQLKSQQLKSQQFKSQQFKTKPHPDSLWANDALISTDGPILKETQGVPSDKPATSPSQVHVPQTTFNRNPFVQIDSRTTEGDRDRLFPPSEKSRTSESDLRAENLKPTDPIKSENKWTSNPFSQAKPGLSPSSDNSFFPIGDEGSETIPKSINPVQPDLRSSDKDFVPNPVDVPRTDDSSTINLPWVENTQFIENDKPPTGSQSTHYLAEIPPGALPGGANKANNTTPPADITGSAPQRPHVLQGAENFVLAAEPKKGDHWKNETPIVDKRAVVIEAIPSDFSPTPTDQCLPYDPYQNQDIYQNKKLNANQRPIVELGRPWYQLGQLSPGSNILGKHNPVAPQFLVFGDVRTAIASNTQNGNTSTLAAFQANLNFDLRVTSTERFHLFMSPLTNGSKSTGMVFDDNQFVNGTNANILAGFFEGDLGAIVGGATNKTLPFDLPFSVGVMPILLQNGVWMEDQILGVAATIPARNSPRFDISNMEFTFFAGYDKLDSDAFPNDDSAAKIYGIASFLEALNGYIEADYAFIEDRTFFDRSYHNVGLGYTRRFGRFVSNSTRAIVNLGQQPDGIEQTADGWLLLSENSLITGAPSTVLPYFNMFAGFDRPQSAGRNGGAGGVLRNTGILFESDNLTGYPTLDATANETFGGAFGLNLLASDFSQQLIVETAFLNTMGNDADRNAPGNQYGLGMRYQLPLTNALIFRTDAMYGFLDNTDDIHGFRVELRHKY